MLSSRVGKILSFSRKSSSFTGNSLEFFQPWVFLGLSVLPKMSKKSLETHFHSTLILDFKEWTWKSGILTWLGWSQRPRLLSYQELVRENRGHGSKSFFRNRQAPRKPTRDADGRWGDKGGKGETSRSTQRSEAVWGDRATQKVSGWPGQNTGQNNQLRCLIPPRR